MLSIVQDYAKYLKGTNTRFKVSLGFCLPRTETDHENVQKIKYMYMYHWATVTAASKVHTNNSAKFVGLKCSYFREDANKYLQTVHLLLHVFSVPSLWILFHTFLTTATSHLAQTLTVCQRKKAQNNPHKQYCKHLQCCTFPLNEQANQH